MGDNGTMTFQGETKLCVAQLYGDLRIAGGAFSGEGGEGGERAKERRERKKV